MVDRWLGKVEPDDVPVICDPRGLDLNRLGKVDLSKCVVAEQEAMHSAGRYRSSDDLAGRVDGAGECPRGLREVEWLKRGRRPDIAMRRTVSRLENTHQVAGVIDIAHIGEKRIFNIDGEKPAIAQRETV